MAVTVSWLRMCTFIPLAIPLHLGMWMDFPCSPIISNPLMHFSVFNHSLYFRWLPEQRFLEGELLDLRKGCLGMGRYEEVWGLLGGHPKEGGFFLRETDARGELASSGLTHFWFLALGVRPQTDCDDTLWTVSSPSPQSWWVGVEGTLM